MRDMISFSSQIVVVVTSQWDATNGWLERFDRDGTAWKAAAAANAVSVGRHGLGWGLGLHPMPEPGPQKKEGDGRSPAGVFRLSYVFGKASLDDVEGIRMPYTQCLPSLVCVDDTNSASYNQIVDASKTPNVDWKSAEKMAAPEEYRLGVVVEHNGTNRPGAGSCIFLHVWGAPGKPTSGCTAMEIGQLEALVAWLDHNANPILVQLPRHEYERLAPLWELPPLPANFPAAP
jgi:D-alanyl-D-alanine dipeptidase